MNYNETRVSYRNNRITYKMYNLIECLLLLDSQVFVVTLVYLYYKSSITLYTNHKKIKIKTNKR
jgi:hypothetical protein